MSKAWRDQRAEAVIEHGPRRVFAAGTAAKIGAGEQNRSAAVPRQVHHEIRIGIFTGQIAPIVKEKACRNPAVSDPSELLGHHLIGVHIDAIERHRESGAVEIGCIVVSVTPRVTPSSYSVTSTPSSRTSTKWPAMAAAAAMTGLTRCVRLSLPWRPSKFRLEVLAQRSPAAAARRRSCRCTCCSRRRATRIRRR